MIFKCGSRLFKIETVNAGCKDNTVWVSHRNGGNIVHFAVYFYWSVDKRIAVSFHGNVRRFCHRLSHIHFNGFHKTVLNKKLQIFYPAFGFKTYFGLVGKTVVIDVFADTAGAVSAHHSLGTVGIKHSHAEIRLVRGHYQYQTVRTYTEVPVAYADGKLLRIFHSFIKAVYINVVVSDTLHFCEFHFSHP